MAHQADSQVLSFIAATGAPLDFFFFEFSHPVNDLNRAINFYTPLLGAPEVVTATKATFNMHGPRFHLDTDNLGGFASVRNNLINGWATFIVDDLAAEKARLEGLGVEFVSGIEVVGVDDRVVGVDFPSGSYGKNIFVLLQKNYSTSGAFNPQSPSIQAEAGVSQAIIDLVSDLETAWLQADGVAVANLLDPDGMYWDDTRSDKLHGAERTPQDVQDALNTTWTRMDQSSSGLIASMDITSLRAKTLGNEIVVSYDRVITGTGDHAFVEASLVTLEVDNTTGKVSRVFNVLLGSTESTIPEEALSLDYTGYPIKNRKLLDGHTFSQDSMDLGVPYEDSGWRGFWSHQSSVFGIFSCSPAGNQGLPIPYKTNGYISWWVESADDTYAWLQAQGAAFPVLSAINSSSSVDNFEGYNQILATDSEGNAVLYTDYPGD